MAKQCIYCGRSLTVNCFGQDERCPCSEEDIAIMMGSPKGTLKIHCKAHPVLSIVLKAYYEQDSFHTFFLRDYNEELWCLVQGLLEGNSGKQFESLMSKISTGTIEWVEDLMQAIQYDDEVSGWLHENHQDLWTFFEALRQKDDATFPEEFDHPVLDLIKQMKTVSSRSSE